MMNAVFWYVTPCRPCRFNSQDLQGATSQKTAFFKITKSFQWIEERKLIFSPVKSIHYTGYLICNGKQSIFYVKYVKCCCNDNDYKVNHDVLEYNHCVMRVLCEHT
jgi:hypothetical protein